MELCQVTIVLCVNEEDLPGVVDMHMEQGFSLYHWMIFTVPKKTTWAKSSVSPMLDLFGIQQTGQ